MTMTMTMTTIQCGRLDGSLLVDAKKVTPGAALASLHKGGLILQGGQSFFQALYFCCPSRFPFLVGHRFRNAPVLDLCIVVQHGTQLRVRCLPISTQLGNLSVKGLELFGAVCNILIQKSCCDLVLLSLLLICGLGIIFL